jgi:large subunit ribosomal protein L21
VQATVLGQGRGKKVVVFKYKPKAHYRRKQGHRQNQTTLRIDKISLT